MESQCSADDAESEYRVKFRRSSGTSPWTVHTGKGSVGVV